MVAGAIAVILARGGSKRLPRKNVRDFLGKPLITHTIEAALRSSVVRRVVVSTDDDEIAAVAMSAGAEVPFRRPPHLATDAASSIDALIHALAVLEAEGPLPERVLLLQPTSPLRTARHIDAASALLDHAPGDASIVSVVAAKPISWMMRLDDEGNLSPAVAPELASGSFFMPNGALYLARVSYLRAHRTFYGPRARPYVMSAESSIDIDSEIDFRFAEVLVEAGARGESLRPEP